MATFNDLSSLPDVEQYDLNRYIISPLFLGQDFMSYMDVMPNIKGKTVIDRFASLTKTTKLFDQAAFSGHTGGGSSTVTVDPIRMESEIEFYANTLFNKIKGQALRSNYNFDNPEGTVVKQVLLELIGQGIQNDFNRQLWLSDATQATEDYGAYNGIFEACKFAHSVINETTTGVYPTATGSLTQTSNAALAAGNGEKILAALYNNAHPTLLEQPDLVFFVSGNIADDYFQEVLSSTGYAAGGYQTLVNGMPVMKYRGIPLVVRRDWDSSIASDHANINGCSDADEKDRAILTCKGAIIVGTDFESNMIEQWYSQDAKAYRFRTSYMVGCALSDSKLASVYTRDAMS